MRAASRRRQPGGTWTHDADSEGSPPFPPSPAAPLPVVFPPFSSFPTSGSLTVLVLLVLGREVESMRRQCGG